MTGTRDYNDDRTSFMRTTIIRTIAAMLVLAPVAASAEAAPPEAAPPVETQTLLYVPPPRFLDVRLVSGYPETIGVCGDYHPLAQLELTLCVGGTRDLVAIAQTAKWSWNTVMTREAMTGIGETSFHGIGLGVRELIAFPASGTGLIVGPELMYAYEHVWWQSKTFGWELSVELGASYGFTRTRDLSRLEVAVNPLARIAFGAAF